MLPDLTYDPITFHPICCHTVSNENENIHKYNREKKTNKINRQTFLKIKNIYKPLFRHMAAQANKKKTEMHRK